MNTATLNKTQTVCENTLVLKIESNTDVEEAKKSLFWRKQYMDLLKSKTNLPPLKLSEISDWEAEFKRIQEYDMWELFKQYNIHSESISIDCSDLSNIPKEFFEMINLQSIVIKGTIDKIPAQFSKFVKLESIHLIDCLFSYIPDEIKSITNLKSLTIDSTAFTSISGINKLSNLESLVLLNTNMSEIHKDIAGLINLTVLNITGGSIRKFPKELGKLINLRELTIANNLIRFIPKEIGTLIQLRKLDMSSNRIGDFSNMTQGEYMYLMS